MIHFMLLGLLVGLMVYPDKAESVQASVSYLHGDGYALGDNTRNNLRLDALTVKDWGMLYGRVDSTSYDDGNSNVFTRFIGHGGRGLHIAGQLQNQYRISQSSAGIGYSDFGKESSWFVDAYRASSNYYGDSTHGFAHYSKVVLANYKFNAFVEYILPDNKHINEVTFSQAQALRKIGDVWVGVEHQRYFNKNGIKALDESVNQFVLKYDF
jgi:hypothetical protein